MDVRFGNRIPPQAILMVVYSIQIFMLNGNIRFSLARYVLHLLAGFVNRGPSHFLGSERGSFHRSVSSFVPTAPRSSSVACGAFRQVITCLDCFFLRRVSGWRGVLVCLPFCLRRADRWVWADFSGPAVGIVGGCSKQYYSWVQHGSTPLAGAVLAA